MASPVSSSSPPLIRVLCLHGFFQSAASFRMKTAALRKTLKKGFEFDYIQAPHELTNADTFRNKPEDIPPASHYCWWKYKEEQQKYIGWEKSVQTIRDYVAANGPYDALMGFSQGASFLAVLATIATQQSAAANNGSISSTSSSSSSSASSSSAAKTRQAELGSIDCTWLLSAATPRSSPDGAADGSLSPQPAKAPALIFISGFIPRVDHLKQLFPRPLTIDENSSADAKAVSVLAAAKLSASQREVATHNTHFIDVPQYEYDPDVPLVGAAGNSTLFRSLHCIGVSDADVPPMESVNLSRCFVDARIESHPNGHVVPSNAEFGRIYKEFLTP